MARRHCYSAEHRRPVAALEPALSRPPRAHAYHAAAENHASAAKPVRLRCWQRQHHMLCVGCSSKSSAEAVEPVLEVSQKVDDSATATKRH
jgi:hypothetical protein